MTNDDPISHNQNSISTLLSDSMLSLMPENKVILDQAIDRAIKKCGGDIDVFADKINIPATEFFSYDGKLQVKADLWRKLMPFLKDDVKEMLLAYPVKFIHQRIDQMLIQNGYQNWEDFEKGIEAMDIELEEDEKFKTLASQLTLLLFIFPELDDEK